MAKIYAQNEYEKEFFKIFESLSMTRSGWRVWSDFITVSAISLSNAFELDSERKAAREKEYCECIKRLGGTEKAAELLGVIVKAFEEKFETVVMPSRMEQAIMQEFDETRYRFLYRNPK